MGFCSHSASQQHVRQRPCLLSGLRHQQVGVYHRFHPQHGLYVFNVAIRLTQFSLSAVAFSGPMLWLVRMWNSLEGTFTLPSPMLRKLTFVFSGRYVSCCIDMMWL
jgi:hypothetical protein